MMYEKLSAMTSSGVLMRRRMGRAEKQAIAVKITDTIMFSITFIATEQRSPLKSFAPNLCAVITANPDDTPKTKPKTKKFIGPVFPTAASAFVPSIRPTMTVSTIEYICWNKLPSKSGME